MITNARPLQPEFIPADVVHRDAEINTLSAALRPITCGERAETALLFGPSGAGKTCIAKHTLDRLEEEVLEVETQYVNCWWDYSPYKTLYRILEGLNKAFDIHRQSTPLDELLDRLHDYNGPPYVVVLDEVDQLEDKDVLYDLYDVQGVELVLIANSDDGLFASFNERVASRLRTATRIRFTPYSTSELVAILEDRVR